MPDWQMPPLAKIYEAFSAVADERVSTKEQSWAEVISSGRDKSYKVEWSADKREFASNDSSRRQMGLSPPPDCRRLSASTSRFSLTPVRSWWIMRMCAQTSATSANRAWQRLADRVHAGPFVIRHHLVLPHFRFSRYLCFYAKLISVSYINIFVDR